MENFAFSVKNELHKYAKGRFAAKFETFSMRLLFVFLLLSSVNTFAQNLTLSGYVRSAETGEEVIGATIFVNETKSGGVTNVYGYYAISLPKGNYNITYSFIGKQPVEKQISLTENTKIDIELKDNQVQLKTVEISAEKKDQNIRSAEISTQKLEMKQVKNLPAFLGEVDVLKTIQLLPGVQSAGDGNTGFFVRGGSQDQNLILLDEAAVYNASHLFNFFSVFNPDAVKDLTLYKGGIPARYGGRLSSVLDIRMKDGNSKQFAASGGLGLISSRLTLEGPLQKNKSSFLITGRRTYADLFLRLSNDDAINQNQLYFYDLNTKINYKINDNNRLFLSGYFGRDVTGFGEFFGFDWGNATGTLRWNHLFSEKLFSNFSLIYTNYAFNISGDIGPATFSWRSYLNDYGIKGDFTYYANSKHTLRWGIQSTLHKFDPGEISAKLEDAFETTTTLSENDGLEHGIYLSDEFKVTDNLLLIYGARLSMFQNIGPDNIYTYDKSDPIFYEVTDTTTIAQNEIYNTQFGFEPRLSLRYTIDETSSIKASYNRLFQYLQQVQSSLSVAPYDIWFLVNNNIPPQIVDQVAAGYYRNFFDNELETSVEVYYKWIQNQTDLVDNADVLGNELFDGQIRYGDGWSYGAEFLAKKQRGLITGWLAYTWSRTERRIPEINNGEAYFAPYDIRNNLTLAGTYQISDRVNIGANFIYTTGRAYTLPIGKYFYNGTSIPLYSKRNSNRLPDYHRLDLSVNIDGKKRSTPEKRKIESSWNISVFNVYARKNPFSVSFAESEETQGAAESNMFYLPGPIPSITWNFSF